MDINDKIKASIDPFRIYKLTLLISEEELAKKLIAIEKDDIANKYVEDLRTNSTTIQISKTIGYAIIKESYYSKIIAFLDHCQFKYKIKDGLEEIWTSPDIKELLNEEDPAPEFTKMCFPEYISKTNLLHHLFEQKYMVNDVLELINSRGIETLNTINRYILTKKT